MTVGADARRHYASTSSPAAKPYSLHCLRYARDVSLYLLFLLFTTAAQADYQAGLDAYLATDYPAAMKEWTAVAEAPPAVTNPAIYAETHYAIAMLYWMGQGVPRDYYQAHNWLLQAAELNHAGAMAKLGYLYTEGIAVPQDFDRAFEYYSEAARLGDVDGQYNLGIFYLNGWGTKQDTTMAKIYLAAATAQGDKAAEEALLTVGAGHARDVSSSEPESPAWPAPTIRDESWIQAQNPAHYTIQVIALSSKSKVEALITGHEDLAPFAIYTVQKSTKPIHILIQGDYPTVDAARTARDAFPREISPPNRVWIRQFVKVQKLIRAEQ